MKTKFILIGLFLLVTIGQLLVPANIIWSHENTLTNGKVFLFRTQPIDPSDPFRGKYVTLNFQDDKCEIDTNNNYNYKEEIYVTISVDTNGFAKPIDVSKEKPSDGDYLKALSRSYYQSNEIRINYPFNRFYMNEEKAKPAELAYFESNRDTAQTTYAQVRIKDGHAVLENVFIDGVELKKIAEMRLAE